jgi:hypothetical protein
MSYVIYSRMIKNSTILASFYVVNLSIFIYLFILRNWIKLVLGLNIFLIITTAAAFSAHLVIWVF